MLNNVYCNHQEFKNVYFLKILLTVYNVILGMNYFHKVLIIFVKVNNIVLTKIVLHVYYHHIEFYRIKFVYLLIVLHLII
jgi:multisubunit Na+/H+ antiporter MnhF subunit